MTEQLLTFGRPDTSQPAVVDVTDVINDISSMLRPTLGESFELHTDLEPSLGSVVIDLTRFKTALINLVINATHAMPTGGELSIVATTTGLETGNRQSLPPGDYVTISVTDTGSGMTPEVRAHAVEPFLTTNVGGTGTGLGLAQVHGLITQSGGGITINSPPGEGTTVQLLLPAVAPRGRTAEVPV